VLFRSYPAGHARNTNNDLEGILAHKFKLFAGFAVKDTDAAIARVSGLAQKSAQEITEILSFDIEIKGGFG